jgi:hypothetical protein
MATKKDPPRTTGNDRQAAADELAGHISAVLNHPDTPACLYNDLADAVCSLDAPRRFFNSAEYIAICLRNHFTGGAR